MKKTIRFVFLVVAALALTPATAGVFDIPVTGVWMKVQDGEVIQWSAIALTEPKTRVDLVSYVENGKRTTHYLIRSACPNGTVASAVLKPGNKLGIGTDCSGHTVAKTAATLDKVQKLPAEAETLLGR